MYIFLSILYAIVGGFIFWRLINKNKKNKIVGAYSGLVFGMIIYYIIVPILTMLNLNSLSEKYEMVNKFIANKDIGNYLYVLFIIIVSFLFLELGYILNINKINNKKKSEVKIENSLFIKVLKIIAWGTFAIGAISMFLFFNGLGGITEALKYGNTARAFYTSLANKMPSYISILAIPARLVTVSPFLFLWIDSIDNNCRLKQWNKYFYKILTIIGFVLSILYFLYNAGKAPLICFMLSFIVAFLYKYTKRVWLFLIPLAFLSMPLLDVIEEIFRFLEKDTWKGIQIDYLKYLNQFIFPFRTLLNVQQINIEFGLRWGKDFITAILNFIPGVQFPVSYENISMFYGGEEWRIKGGVPSDLITFLYTQFSLLGLPFLFFILGRLLRYIDGGLRNMKENVIAKLIATTICIHIFIIVSSADFESIIRGSFILIILSFLFIISNTNLNFKNRRKK